MTTAHKSDQIATTRTGRRMAPVASRALLGTLIGAAPGAALVLVAQFLIDGEMQLTVGAPGILLGAAGGLAGLVIGARQGLDDQHS